MVKQKKIKLIEKRSWLKSRKDRRNKRQEFSKLLKRLNSKKSSYNRKQQFSKKPKKKQPRKRKLKNLL